MITAYKSHILVVPRSIPPPEPGLNLSLPPTLIGRLVVEVTLLPMIKLFIRNKTHVYTTRNNSEVLPPGKEGGQGWGALRREERLITFLNFYLWHSRKRLGVTHTLIIHGSAALRRRGSHFTGSSAPRGSTASRNPITYVRKFSASSTKGLNSSLSSSRGGGLLAV